MFFIFPTGAIAPMQRTPWVTYSLAVLLGVVHIAVLSFTIHKHYPIQEVFNAWGYVPANRDPITLFTHLFLHAGFLHLLGNIWFLLLFGRIVEDRLGPFLFLLLFFASGLGSVALQDYFTIGESTNGMILGRNMPLVGASGAIFGLMGGVAVVAIWVEFRFIYFFFLLFYIRAGSVKLVTHFVCAYYIFWNVVDGLLMNWVSNREGYSVGGVASWAHVGGFVTGISLTLLLKRFAGRFLPFDHTAPDTLDSIKPHRGLGFQIRRTKTGITAEQRAVENLLRLLHRGRDELLVERYIEHVTEFPNLTLPPPQMSTVAELLEQAGERDQAIVAWQKVVLANPEIGDHQRALMQLGRLCSDAPHLHSEGIGRLNRLLTLRPDPAVQREAERLLMKMGASIPKAPTETDEPESDLTRDLEAQAQGINRPAYIPSDATPPPPQEEPDQAHEQPFAPPANLPHFGPAYIPDDAASEKSPRATHAVILTGHGKIDVPRVSQIIARATQRSMVDVSRDVSSGMGVVHEGDSVAIALDITNRLCASRIEAASVNLSQLPAWTTTEISRATVESNALNVNTSGGAQEAFDIHDIMVVAHASINEEIVFDALVRSHGVRLRAFETRFQHTTPSEHSSLISFAHLVAKRAGHAMRDIGLQRTLTTDRSACLRFESIEQFETYQRWLALSSIAASTKH